METIKVDPKECVRQRTVEQFGNVQPVPQFREQISEVVTVILQERISWCVSFQNYHIRGLVQDLKKVWERSSLARKEQACHVELLAFQRGSKGPVSVGLWSRYQPRRCCSSSMEV